MDHFLPSHETAPSSKFLYLELEKKQCRAHNMTMHTSPFVVHCRSCMKCAGAVWEFLMVWACRFNATVFGNRLPEDLEISWNAHLRTTAGTTHYKREPPTRPTDPPRLASISQSHLRRRFPKLLV